MGGRFIFLKNERKRDMFSQRKFQSDTKVQANDSRNFITITKQFGQETNSPPKRQFSINYF